LIINDDHDLPEISLRFAVNSVKYHRPFFISQVYHNSDV
jgi:hypothetical protein